jgi:hypothetical protein
MQYIIVMTILISCAFAKCRVRPGRKEAVCIGSDTKPTYLKFMAKITVKCGDESFESVSRRFRVYGDKVKYIGCKNTTEFSEEGTTPFAQVSMLYSCFLFLSFIVSLFSF